MFRLRLDFLNKVLVTGGCGFIGSYLVDSLMGDGYKVTILDNLSSGSIGNLRQWIDNPNFKFINGDLKEREAIKKSLREIELVFHLAANPEVTVGVTNPLIHFNENLLATFNLLENMKESKKAKAIVFASTSTVYGEAWKIPTPEEYAPLLPISTYGASKLGCEALISSYVSTFGLKGLILRLANIVGPRAKHGVVVDFAYQIMNNPRRLKILGDGSQKKSYLYIQDCLDAISCITEDFVKNQKNIDIYNIGSIDQVTTLEIAKIISEEIGVRDIQYSYTDEANGGRGWPGDVKIMQLSIDKLLKIGWKPRHSSRDAIRLAAKKIIMET